MVEITQIYVEHIFKARYNVLYINRSLIEIAIGVECVDKFHQCPFCPRPPEQLLYIPVFDLLALETPFKFIQSVGEVDGKQFDG